MPRVLLSRIERECSRLLEPEAFEDWEGACNGLQVENDGRVTRIAAAVDASLATVTKAVAAQADLLIVHHGLFWSRRYPWTGNTHRLLRLLMDHNLAVYSSHLPLDAHPKLGNNALICSALGLRKLTPFFECKGQPIGFRAAVRLGREALVERLEKALAGRVTLLPGGPAVCRRIGVVSGGVGAELVQAAREGVDTLVTGEGPHWTYALAEETGINVLYGGHYATETFGVKALAEHLAAKFGLPCTFVDHPTGL